MDQISEPLKADSSPQMCFVCWHYVGSHKFSILTSFLNCFLAECVHAKLFQSCPTLCNSMDYSLLGSSVRGILQARILEWVVTPSFRESFQPRDRTQVSCIAGRFFTGLNHQGSPCILERVAYPFSRGSSRPRNQTSVSCISGRFFTS